MWCTCCKGFIDKLFSHKIMKLQSPKNGHQILCAHKLYFLMLHGSHIISRGYGNIYRKPSVDEMGPSKFLKKCVNSRYACVNKHSMNDSKSVCVLLCHIV